MLTPHLENLIHKGKARFRTFVCGQSGSNALIVRDNTWIIITGFTYLNFYDFVRFGVDPRFDDVLSRSIHQLRFRSSKSNNHYILKDDIIRAPGDPGSDINQLVNGDFSNGQDNWSFGAGWSIVGGAAQHLGAAGLGFLGYVPFVSLSERKYRLTYEVTAVAAAGSIQPTLGGTQGFTRSTVGIFTEEITTVQFGSLSFLAPAIVAGDDITIDNIELILLPSEETVVINSHYKFDCYLPHQNDVSVELVGWPDVDGFPIQGLAAAPASFPLAAPPVGYGNAGFGGITQVTEFQNQVNLLIGPNPVRDSNLPLTRKHSAPSVGPPFQIAQNGMELPVTPGTAIIPPFFTDATPGALRNFPIVDIQYVEIDGNMPGNIQGSN